MDPHVSEGSHRFWKASHRQAGESKSEIEGDISPYCHMEWCIRRLWCSSTILCNITSIAYNTILILPTLFKHTNISTDKQTIQHRLATLKTEITIGRTFADKCLQLLKEKKLDNSTASMAK